MQLSLNSFSTNNYKSLSQKARVLTESWVSQSVFCPNCGRSRISSYENNRPVADFYCSVCSEQYELKSKNSEFGSKITDGAYSTMIERLNSENNPNLFILSYDLKTYLVKDFLVIPKHFFIPRIIEKRKPLSDTARRAGWVGCNIVIGDIPEVGKVYYLRAGKEVGKQKVLENWQKTLFLRENSEVAARGWLLEIMRIIDKLGKAEFALDDLYAYEHELALIYPDNHHIKDKIRQQLQILRDHNYLQFMARGKYRLI